MAVTFATAEEAALIDCDRSSARAVAVRWRDSDDAEVEVEVEEKPARRFVVRVIRGPDGRWWRGHAHTVPDPRYASEQEPPRGGDTARVSARLERAVRRMFPPTEVDWALARLSALDLVFLEKRPKERERVQAAVVRNPPIDWTSLAAAVDAAEIDWRDVLLRTDLAAEGWPRVLRRWLGSETAG